MVFNWVKEQQLPENFAGPVKIETAADFSRETNVSREKISALQVYFDLLQRWQKQINLVGPKTLNATWGRHFYDSAQLVPLIESAGFGLSQTTFADLGAGAGFPGLVLSILGAEHVHLIESNGKKCAFMRQVIRETGLAATVHQKRIEDVKDIHVDIVTSRALATVDILLQYAQNFFHVGTEIWLLKSQYVEDELTETPRYSNMKAEIYPSRTDARGRIIRILGAGGQ